MRHRRGGPVRISAALERFFAELNPSPNGKGPEDEPPALFPTGQTQPIQASDGTPHAYTFERFHEQTAHLAPEQRLAVFQALPVACRADMWRAARKQSNGRR